MAAVGVRTRPLVAVIYRVPLLVEALQPAFGELADVQPVSAEDGSAAGLLRALRPDAVVAEAGARHLFDDAIPCVEVELELQRLWIRDAGAWREIDSELSPTSIRNAVVAQLYGGDLA